MKKYGVYLVVILVIVLLVYVFSLKNEVSDGVVVDNDGGDGDVIEPDGDLSPGGVVEGLAVVEEVEIFMLESFPIQINVVARGYLNDGCTNLGEIKQELIGNEFSITINKVRSKDLLCTQATVPFSEIISLSGAVGLSAGDYVVNVNDVEAEFSLDVDNVAQEIPRS